jgi:hypothetical protein
MVDWQWDLARNAAKPLHYGTKTTKKTLARRRTTGTAPSSRTASTD